MRFQYDPKKSASNLRKYGIDFEQAQLLWDDSDFVEVTARFDDKPRSILIASLDNQRWSAVFTYRGDEIRLISVRRSRKAEVELYES
ncbi:MAG: BrnT family toxin [Congregibacter sp.]